MSSAVVIYYKLLNYFEEVSVIDLNILKLVLEPNDYSENFGLVTENPFDLFFRWSIYFKAS